MDDDPGVALLQLAEAYERAGMDRYSARRRVFAEHPLVAQAWHEGRLIPKARSSMRRVRAADMVEGRPYLHKCSDEASGGGIFELAA